MFAITFPDFYIFLLQHDVPTPTSCSELGRISELPVPIEGDICFKSTHQPSGPYSRGLGMNWNLESLGLDRFMACCMMICYEQILSSSILGL